MAEGTEQTKTRNRRRVEYGVVTSAKAAKTLQVRVAYKVRHVKYGKYVRRQLKLHVHDERGEAKEGDRVEVAECRPISKTKTWRLVKVLEAAPA